MTAGWNSPGDTVAEKSDEDGLGSPSDTDDRLPDQARRAYVALLTNRYISRGRNRTAWEGLLAYESEIRDRLDELFLDLVIDRDAEVAFKRQQDGEEIPHLLRREKPLTRDASFVLLFLRRECAFADPADGPVVVSRDQIAEFLRAFRQEGDTDDARFARRVVTAINALVKPMQFLIPDPAADYLFTVSPVIVPLLSADEIQRLTAAFRDGAEAAEESTVSADDFAPPGDEPAPDEQEPM